jgi:hypothetical protein
LTPFLTVRQAAETIGMSERWLRERIRGDEIPNRRLPHSNRILFQADWLEMWADGCELERVDLPHGGRIVRPVNGTNGDGA